jgi:K+-sensing histidine kinase KdpD
VSDVGPGIPADELPHIFERFYQGSTKSRHSVPGSGLGLALAKKSSKRTEEGFGSKAKSRRVRLYGLSCA